MAGFVDEFRGPFSLGALSGDFDGARDKVAFEEIIARLSPAERDRLQEIEDLSAGQAGRENGRIPLGGYAQAKIAVEKQKQNSDRSTHMTLAQLLTSTAYRAAYNDTMDTLIQYENAAAIAMEKAALALDSAEEALAETMSQAARLEDGSPVFRGPNGEAVDIDGNPLSADDADSVIGLDDAPLYAQYLADKQAVEDAYATIEAIRIYQVETLGNARERLEDTANPVQRVEGIEAIQDDIRDAAPEFVSTQIKSEAVIVPPEPQELAAVAVPTALR